MPLYANVERYFETVSLNCAAFELLNCGAIQGLPEASRGPSDRRSLNCCARLVCLCGQPAKTDNLHFRDAP